MFVHNHRLSMMQFGKVKLIPGDNELTSEEATELLDPSRFEAGFKSAVKAGWLEVSEKPREAITDNEADAQLEALRSIANEPVSDTSDDALAALMAEGK